MLKITRKTEYALIALKHLQMNRNNLISAKEISNKYSIPKQLLAKILQQMSKLNYSIKIKKINIAEVGKKILNYKDINIIDVDFKFKKIFDKISINSSNYIKKCFDISLSLLIKNKCLALINGPISKKHFLKKKYLLRIFN